MNDEKYVSVYGLVWFDFGLLVVFIELQKEMKGMK